jgi:hypothetical protein
MESAAKLREEAIQKVIGLKQTAPDDSTESIRPRKMRWYEAHGRSTWVTSILSPWQSYHTISGGAKEDCRGGYISASLHSQDVTVRYQL